MKKPKLKLDWCSHKAVLYAVQHWHYSGTLPRGKLVKIGVWEDDQYIGCVIFSMGASSQLHQRYGIGKLEVCELTRVALTTHQTPVSRIVSIALRMLKKYCPGLRLVVSFADPHEGHIGGIYQAMGWIYTGRSNESVIYTDRKGKQWHIRNIADSDCHSGDWWGTVKHSKEGMRKEKRPGKYRYVMPLDRETRKKVEPLAKPYPKGDKCESE